MKSNFILDRLIYIFKFLIFIQYARYQRKFMRKIFRKISSLKKVGQLKQRLIYQDAHTLNLDTSKDFYEVVVPAAINFVEQYLSKERHSTSVEDQSSNIAEYHKYQAEANQLYKCDVCKKEIHGYQLYQSHLKGNKHRYALARRKREENQEVG